MNKYILDVSKVTDNRFPKEVIDFKYTLVDYEHNSSDLKLIEDNIPKDIYQKMVSIINSKETDMDVVISMKDLPIGAIVTKVSK